ncbi:MAG: DUF11 domain-containing protein [Planctomycetes bacterium]|nr:DUF11 domain-containing protein [Planctomycetota bacterium]
MLQVVGQVDGSHAALTKLTLNGVATFGDLKVDRAGTGYQLTAASGGLTPADSLVFAITADPALTLVKADSSDPVDPNTEVTYTITYGNIGLGDAHTCTIVETLPAGLTYVSSSAGGVYDDASKTITWSVGTIGATVTGQTVTFIARVSSSLDGGIITNSSLTIDCDETDPVAAPAETTTINDNQGPEISGLIPAVDAQQAPRKPLIQMHITDAGSGVKYDGGTVTITVEGDLIYDGSNETADGEYDTSTASQSVRGVFRRTGTAADFQFSFTPITTFDFEQQVNVVVDAIDNAGNQTSVSYHFTTETRFFGQNAQVNSDSGTLDQDNPATAVDSLGNTWVVWDQVTAGGDTDIYVGQLAAAGDSFGASNPVFMGPFNQSHPVIAVDGSDTLYVAWQGIDPNGFWDVYVSMSADGSTWSDPLVVNVGDLHRKSSQMRPSIGIDRLNPNTVYIAYEDNRAGNQDIWLASSTDGSTWTETQITDDPTDQTQPDVTVSQSDNSAHVLWTDARNAGSLDIFGASSSDGPWTNTAYVTGAGNEFAPSAVVNGVGHALWIRDVGSNSQVFYGNDQTVPVTGESIVDEANTTVSDPSLALRLTGNKAKLFAAWTDGRDDGGNGDTDIYFAENGSPFSTNILVNDDTGTSAQSKPAVGVANGNPYVVWVDERNGNKDIYYAGATDIGDPLVTTIVPEAARTVIKTSIPNLALKIPTGALPDGVTVGDITFSLVQNPPAFSQNSGDGIGLNGRFCCNICSFCIWFRALALIVSANENRASACITRGIDVSRLFSVVCKQSDFFSKDHYLTARFAFVVPRRVNETRHFDNAGFSSIEDNFSVVLLDRLGLDDAVHVDHGIKAILGRGD